MPPLLLLLRSVVTYQGTNSATGAAAASAAAVAAAPPAFEVWPSAITTAAAAATGSAGPGAGQAEIPSSFTVVSMVPVKYNIQYSTLRNQYQCGIDQMCMTIKMNITFF